jgi:hypothetical protein
MGEVLECLQMSSKKIPEIEEIEDRAFLRW